MVYQVIEMTWKEEVNISVKLLKDLIDYQLVCGCTSVPG